MDKVRSVITGLGGRKFIMAVATVVAIALKEKLGINEEQVMYIAGVAATFILGQSAADAVSKGETASKP